MGPKNVVVSAFTRLRASNLDGTTMKIYHRIRNVKNAERNEKRWGRKRKGGKRTHAYIHTYKRKRRESGAEREERRTRDSCASSKAAGRWSLIQVECVFEDFVAGSYANSPGMLVCDPGEKGGPDRHYRMINCRAESPRTTGAYGGSVGAIIVVNASSMLLPTLDIG